MNSIIVLTIADCVTYFCTDTVSYRKHDFNQHIVEHEK